MVKKVLLILFILLCVVFVFLKLELIGNPSSKFNQTTRFQLARNGWLRTIFSLHNAGDNRANYLLNTDPLVVEWAKPVEENIDPAVLQNFANTVSKRVGRPVQLEQDGAIDDGTLNLNDLKSLQLQSQTQTTNVSSDVLLVIFANDYSPRQSGELSTTDGDSTEVISLTAMRQFLGNLSGYNMDNYLLSSMLHEFGHEIGLPYNSESDCIMDEHAGQNGQPVELYGQKDPQDYCPMEIDQINSIKQSLQ